MSATFYIGDAIETMNKLPAGSVDLILTSPPFLALRSYLPADHPDKAKEGGSQSTPGEFIDWLIDFAEASARVLAPHGSFCVELGDTYSGSGEGGGDVAGTERYPAGTRTTTGWRSKNNGAWPLSKSLSLIPELFRLSLVYGFNPLTGRTTDRWRLRNVVRWVRPNPPVGALGDKFRPATSELMVFCKSAKRYFDLDAVREPPTAKPQRFLSESELRSGRTPRNENRGPGEFGKFRSDEVTSRANPAGAPPLDYWNIPLVDGDEETRYGPKEPKPDTTRQQRAFNKLDAGGLMSSHAMTAPNHPLGAPPLDWWEIPPGGYEGSHYAVFPLELCVRPVKAMSPERVCKVCGEPSRRIVEVEYEMLHSNGPKNQGRASETAMGNLTTRANRISNGAGWSDCGHDSWRPGLILDPFGGSGTVAAVATGHGRDCILIDLDERNFDLALGRVGPFMLTLGNIDE